MLRQVLASDNYVFAPHAIPPLVTALAVLLLGAAVVIREKGTRASLLYLTYTLTAFLWLFSLAAAWFAVNIQVVFWWAKTAHVGITLLPAALYHFTVVQLKIDQKNRRYVRGAWALAALFLGAALFTDGLFHTFYHYSWGPFPKYTWMSVPLFAYFFVMMVNILRPYWMEYRRSGKQTTQRRRARAFLTAFGIGYLAAFDFLPAVGISYFPLGYVPMFLLVVLSARAVWRYRLVDITPAFAAREIIDTMSDGLLVLDHEGFIRVLNRAAVEIFGRSEQEMTGRHVTTIFTGDLFAAHLEAVNTTGRRRYFEISCPGCGGAAVVIGFSVSALKDPSGQAVGFVSVARDITERKKMEEELLKTQKLESLGILAGGIAHDYNNFLTAVMGNISLAKMTMKPGDVAYKRLQEAEEVSLRMKDLTQQILTFSKGGAPVKKTVSIGELVEDSTLFALRGSAVSPQFRVSAGLLPADVDESQIRQVISNLVVNADQAMPHGGTIEVRCENVTLGAGSQLPLEPGDYVQISIGDHGTGIPKEHLPRIFDPYFTTKKAGSGLGLSTAYSIVKSHGGYISVESLPGAGTTFHVYMPASQKKPHPESRRSGEVLSGKGRILAMDDEHIVRDVACRMLSHLGYEVEAASNGDEAVRRYQEAQKANRPFDLVILDLTVPGGMGGKETIKKLLEADPAVRAVVSSGYSDDPVMSDYRSYGFVGVLRKPYNTRELSESVHAAMKARNGRMK